MPSRCLVWLIKVWEFLFWFFLKVFVFYCPITPCLLYFFLFLQIPYQGRLWAACESRSSDGEQRWGAAALGAEHVSLCPAHIMTKAADVSPSCQWPFWLPCPGWSTGYWTQISTMCLWQWKVNALTLMNSALFFEPSEVSVPGCNKIIYAKPKLQSTDHGPFLAMAKYPSLRAWQFYGCSNPWTTDIKWDNEMFAETSPTVHQDQGMSVWFSGSAG